ncbi:MAG: hypothetical protein AAGD06_07285 [Acidobacteriota bacterium]
MKLRRRYLLPLTAALLLLLSSAALAQDEKGQEIEQTQWTVDQLEQHACNSISVVDPLMPNPILVKPEAKLSGAGGVQSRIQNGPCSFCTSNSSCSTQCIDDNNQQSTCGDYGACDPCREALVEIGRTTVAQRATDPFFFTCEFKWWYQVTYRSLNSTSCQTYTFCERETTTSHSTGYTEDCCQYIAGGCFGATC